MRTAGECDQQSGSIWQLAVLTATVWFHSGIGHTLISILTGLFAEEAERGKVFGTFELTTGLGSVLGGLTFGLIADTWAVIRPLANAVGAHSERNAFNSLET